MAYTSLSEFAAAICPKVYGSSTIVGETVHCGVVGGVKADQQVLVVLPG
jgi:hypothetical protein